MLDKFRLDGKVSVVTGATSGLGVAIAIALAEAGSDLVLAGRRVERLSVTESQIVALGRKVVSVQTDVTSPEACQHVADVSAEQLGGVDILINAAGLGAAIPASRETPSEFRSVIETNLMGTYWMAQACSKYMRFGSSIINVSSVMAFSSAGLPQASYSSSKSAVIGLTRDLAQQWSGRKGIRVNALAPGYFPTEMTDEMNPDLIAELMKQRVPLGRMGTLDECAAAAVFLASDAASYITGTYLVVDGGFLA